VSIVSLICLLFMIVEIFDKQQCFSNTNSLEVLLQADAVHEILPKYNMEDQV